MLEMLGVVLVAIMIAPEVLHAVYEAYVRGDFS